MAREYYFDDIIALYFSSAPYIYESRAAKARRIGGSFAYCVYDTMKDHGIQLDTHSDGPQEYLEYLRWSTMERYKARIRYYRNGMLAGVWNDGVEITLTERNILFIDFKFDALLSKISNEKLMADIKAKAVEKRLIDENAKIHTTSKRGLPQSESELGPKWWMC